MAEYLWEIEIEKIPLGWQNTFDKAKEYCPNGEIVAMPNMDYEEHSVDRYFYHPVGYRDELINQFNMNKLKAAELLKEKDNFEMKLYFNELVKLDIKLFNILVDWLSPEHYRDGSTMDPRNIKQDITNDDEYIHFHPLENERSTYRQYLSLKLLNLS